VLVNLNYQIDVHMKFAQSRFPALVCSPQSEYGCHQARSHEGQRGNAIPNSKVFRLMKYWSISQRNISVQINETASKYPSYFSS